MSKSNNRKGADDIYDQNPNIFTNGAFNVWQRGNIFDGTFINKYTADRWILTGGAGCGMHEDLNGDKFMSISPPTGVGNQTILQRIEAQFLDPIEFMDVKVITVSFRVLTTKTSGHTEALLNIYEPGARDDWSSRTAVASYSEPYSADGNEHVIEFHVDVSKLNFHKGLAFEIGLDKGTTDVFIMHAKAEFNEYATPFIPDHPRVELDKCQRYYRRIPFTTSAYGTDVNISCCELDYRGMRDIGKSYKVLTNWRGDAIWWTGKADTGQGVWSSVGNIEDYSVNVSDCRIINETHDIYYARSNIWLNDGGVGHMSSLVGFTIVDAEL